MSCLLQFVMSFTITNKNAICQKQVDKFFLENHQGSSVNPSVVSSPQIVISEKEYLSLKCEVGYRLSMHKKALSKIEKLENIIKHQKGQMGDLKKRVFGKKSEKKNSNKKDGNDQKNKGAGGTMRVLMVKSAIG